ncbi:MAG TPA: PIG-L deacetylase family protein [Chitinophaga sp.]|uniref:PIG-L deacetylase family protein n=1 Tax=Chitinophaga sp. TaxID=1869181 RepID=UPI002F935DEC
MNKVIVISAHPDDEVLGAGGAMLRHVSKGDEVYWLIVTNISEAQGFSAEKVLSRQKEIDIVGKMLGVKKTFKLDYPTMSLTSGSLLKLVPDISAIFQEVRPEIIYCLNRSDAHSDHRVLFDATMACTKSFRYPFIKQVLMYECISETEFAPALPEKVFIPNYFIDITPFMEDKLEIMKIYASELGEHPFPRSLANIRALAHFRGAVAGVQYAEAFQLIKFIDKD